MILSLYARLMCRLIWAARSILPAKDGALPDISWLRRDWEYHGWHHCEVCNTGCRHRFIEWIEPSGPVTTAECSHCGFEGTL